MASPYDRAYYETQRAYAQPRLARDHSRAETLQERADEYGQRARGFAMGFERSEPGSPEAHTAECCHDTCLAWHDLATEMAAAMRAVDEVHAALGRDPSDEARELPGKVTATQLRT
jgi:hypothetical protein